MPHTITRWPVLQKVHGHLTLPLLVSIRFQVLFHSPPGVLFTVPSQYYSLSVTRSYLGLGDGPPSFTPDFSCPVLLRILTWKTFNLNYGAFTLFRLPFQISSSIDFLPLCQSLPRSDFSGRFGLLQFRSPLLSQSLFYFLFLRVLRCFSSPGSPHLAMYLLSDNIVLPMLCFHIRISTDLRLCASPRSFSQLITSFFGA